MGVYHCPSCGFSRPKILFDASDISMKDGLSFRVGNDLLKADYRGFYNIYNILAVYSALSMSGHSPEKLNEVLSTLSSREREVLELRFGLKDGRQRTLEEVGQHFGVTRERIRQIEAKALRRLRSKRCTQLRDFVAD